MVTILCTGLGVVAADGTTMNPVSLTIGGMDAPASPGALLPGNPGVYQVTAAIPNGISGDAVAVVLTVAGESSPPVTMAVQ
jgi:uncharacterized protein (TIGR03437 family)